jgi:predicted dehydrogenase
VRRDDVEGVVVTVPNDHHADVIERAARAGKHVFVEKPIAVMLDDARRIERVTDECGVVFACGHSARRLGGLREIKRMMDAGDIGGVSTVEAVFANERGLELEPGNWRGDPVKTPGGPLTQLGVHQIDNLQYLLGPVARVASFGRPMYTRVQNQTVNQTLLEFESGQLAYLGTNWACPGVFSLNVYGTQADLFYQLDFGWWSNSDVTDAHSTLTKREFASLSDDPDDRQLRDVTVAIPDHDHLRDEVDEFADAVRGRCAVEVGADAAIRNVAVVLAALKSSQEGRIVPIGEVLGRP